MHNFLLVHIVKCRKYLKDEASRIGCSEVIIVRTDLIQDIHQVAILDQLHREVEIVIIFEQFKHVDDVRVNQVPQHV